MLKSSAPVLIDTHAHLYLPEFEEDRAEMLHRAQEAGIAEIYLPNIDSRSIGPMQALEAAHPGLCHAMMGLHPCSVKADFEEELAVVRHWLDKRPFAAIGEIGIDLYWDSTTFDIQEVAFRRQIGWAKELDLPIVVHSRDSTEEVLDILASEKNGRLRGILHCFTGTVEQAKQAWSLGFHLGIGGVVTFKNSGLDNVVEQIPLDWLVLETDAPYLAPVPHRGKRNETAYTKLVAEQVAKLKGIDYEEVASQTSLNAKNIFLKRRQAYTTLY
jgi:TatD DNase family protein